MQLKVFTELQATIVVRKCERALDVVLDRLTGCIGEVVQRQDDDMVANAHTAIFASVSPECRFHMLPPLGLQIVDVHVFTLFDGLNNLADISPELPILYHSTPSLPISHSLPLYNIL